MIEQSRFIDLSLLGRLKKNTGKWFDVHSLARSHGLSVELLDRELRRISTAGYTIENDPVSGVRLTTCPGGLSAIEIACDLGTELIGREVKVADELASTSDRAWEFVRKELGRGADLSEIDGTAIIARRQTAGRGRRKRSWASPEGGLWMSVILHTVRASRRQPMLTIAAGVAVVEAVKTATGIDAQIRWPNDVLIDGRKVAGVLVEAQSAYPDLYVLGTGVNVNVSQAELPAQPRTTATSLLLETGRNVPLVTFARTLLQRLDTWHNTVHAGDTDKLNYVWRRMTSTLGQRIAVVVRKQRLEGVVVELDLFEGISMRLDGGAVRTIPSEEVSSVEVLNW